MASTRARGGRYTALYRDRQGHQRSAGTYDDKKTALKKAQAAEAIEATGRDARFMLKEPEVVYPERKRGQLTVAGYAGEFLAGHRLEDTSRENYGHMMKHVIRGLGSVPLADLDAATVRKFLRGLEVGEKLSSATVAHIKVVLRELCRTAVIDGYMTADPTAGVKTATPRPKQMVIATSAQARAIQDAIGQPYKLLAETMFATGMRYGELMGLRPQDISVNGTRAAIHVRGTIAEVHGKPVYRSHGKTAQAARTISIEPELARRLLDNARDGFVFRAPQGGYLRRANFHRYWKPAVAAAGLPGMRPHDARHSHLSWLANDPSIPLALVRDRAGHASLSTTSRYIHVIDNGEDPILAALRKAA